jgi:hypothetical protein
MSEETGGAVTIEHGGKTFVGTYAVRNDVLELWTIGNDGERFGPMSTVLGGTPPKAAACMLLIEYANVKGCAQS